MLSAEINTMLQNYLVRYVEIPSGYMGQLVEWPEVITEGATLTECREYLIDALQEWRSDVGAGVSL
jgi:predicted RNase H-like HicB family nuclease